MRTVPVGVEPDVFAAFEKWANKNDIGIYEEDWIPWFDCWLDGYYKGAEDWKN